jgi:integrase/recombinase XerC
MQSIDQAIIEWLEEIADTRSDDTHHAYTYAMRVFQKWLAKEEAPDDLGALQMPLLKSYVNYLLSRRLADRTRHQYIDVLNRWISSLVESGELAGIPNDRGRLVSPAGIRTQLERQLPRLAPSVAPRMPDLRRLPAYYDERLTDFLQARGGHVPTAEEPAALRTYLNLLRNQALIAVLFSSGGRVNEVLAIDVDHVLRRGKLTDTVLVRGKGRKQRVVYLNTEAQTAIRAYLSARKSYFSAYAPLFLSHGPRAKGQRLSDISAWRLVKEAAEALADLRESEGADEAEVQMLRDVSPHGLRHFFAQSMLDEGADYRDIAGALGHSSTKVTEQVYARQSDDEVLEVVATFAARPAVRFRDEGKGKQNKQTKK